MELQTKFTFTKNNLQMTLFVGSCTGQEPFPFWRQLGQPMAIALPLPELNSLEIITSY